MIGFKFPEQAQDQIEWFFGVQANRFTTFAGTPATTTSSGTSLFTTAPAAITTLEPTVTPGSTKALAPIQTSSPIVTLRGNGKWKAQQRQNQTSEERVGHSPSRAWLLSLHPLRSASSSTLELFLKSFLLGALGSRVPAPVAAQPSAGARWLSGAWDLTTIISHSYPSHGFGLTPPGRA